MDISGQTHTTPTTGIVSIIIPYVWYPQNYYADGYMKSANDLYHRYPQEMRVPVYNRSWQNYYPKSRRYYQGHHFQLDVF